MLLLLALAVASAGVAPLAAAGADSPPELRYVCIDAQDDVIYAASPADCSSGETLKTLPDDGPVHWCADHLGRLTEAAGEGECGTRESPLTIPDDGPIFVCARNIQGGTTLPRGALRTVHDLSECDRDETGLATPAAPEGVSDTYTVDEDTVLVVPDKGVLDNDLDLTGEPLIAHLESSPAKGTFALSAEGGFSFDPRGAFETLDADETATATFTYRADDGALTSEPTTATITITGRNDRPAAADDVIRVNEDIAYQLSPPGLLANDTDAENHALTAELLSGPDAGSLDLRPDGGLIFDPGPDFQHLGATEGELGRTTFGYVVRDGTTSSDAATVTIEVEGVNDAPVGSADAFAIDENSALDITPAQLLGNDTDAEGQRLTVADVVFPSTDAGGLTTLPDGTLRFDPRVDSADPDGEGDFDHLETGQTAIASFTYRADDGSVRSEPVTVAITVHGRSAPTAPDHEGTTDEDHEVAIDLFDGARVEGGTLTLDTSTTEGEVRVEGEGVVRYDPRGTFDHVPAGGESDDAFGYTLTNDEGRSTGTVTLRVDGVNDAPVAAADTYAGPAGSVLTVPAGLDGTGCGTQQCGLLANDTDVDSPKGELVAHLVSPPDRGRLTLEPDGAFAFDPAGEFGGDGGQTTFTYRTADGIGESATVSVTLVVSTNEPPRFSDEQYGFTILTTAASGAPMGSVAATDDDNDPLSFTIVAADTDAFRLDRTTGELTVGPEGPPADGTYSLTVQVSDSRGGTDVANVTVRVVTELNAGDDTYTAVGNTELVGGAPAAGSFTERAAVHVGNLLANDGAATATRAVADLVTGKGGSVDIAGDGSFVYTPPPADPADPAAWNGRGPLTDTFTYTIEGDGVKDAEGQVTVTVLDAVWYVDNLAAGQGTGTAWDPFSTLGGVSGDVADADLPGQTIFLFGHPDDPATPDVDESSHAGGIALENGQHLVGHGAGLTVGDAQVAAPGPVPRVTGADSASAVGLATDNDLRGFTVGGNGTGVTGSAVGNLRAVLPEVETAGDPVDLAAGATPTTGLDVQIGSARGAGLSLTALGGTVRIGSTELSGGSGGLAITDATGKIDLGSVALGNGRARIIGHTGDGQVAIGRLDGSGADTGVDVTGNDGIVRIDQIMLDGVGDTGVQISGGDVDGTTTIGDGTIRGDAASLSNALVEITGGTDGTVTIGADIVLELSDSADAVTGRSVSIVDVGTAGVVELAGLVADRGLGLHVTDVDGAVRATGGLDVVTTGSPALYGARIDSLEVLAASPGSVLSATADVALQLDSVDIGAAGARFDRVDSPGVESGGVVEPTDGAIELEDVTPASAAGPGLTVAAGDIAQPVVAGVTVNESFGITLSNLAIEGSEGDGVILTNSTSITLDGVSVVQPDGTGVIAQGSGDLHIERSTVTAAGQNGIRLSDLNGQTTIRQSTLEGSHDVQLLVADNSGGSAPDTVVLDGTVISGGSPEADSIAVIAGDDGSTSADAAHLEFRVAGSGPSGAVGGDVGLNVDASGGAQVHVALNRFAVAGTAGDGIRLGARDSGTALTFDLATLNAEGGGGVQVTGGAGIRAVGDGLATIGGTMNQVQVVSATDSGIVLDRVGGVRLASTGTQASGGHGIEVTGSSQVTLDHAEVVRPAEHGLYVFDAVDVRVDDSRFDLRPPPPATDDEDTYPDNSAIWMRHLGGTGNAVTDTTLLGSTGSQLMVLQGTTVSALPSEPAPEGVELEGAIQVSGLTTDETALDPDPDDQIETDGDAVEVIAGKDADLTVNLAGGASHTDDRIAMTAESAGTLTVLGGHLIEHDGVDDSVQLVADGAGANLKLGLSSLKVTQVPPEDAGVTPQQGVALGVRAQSGGTVAPRDDGDALASTSIDSLGRANAVHLEARYPGSSLEVDTDGLDIEFKIPAGGPSSTADALAVTALDEAVVTGLDVYGGSIAAHGGEAIDFDTTRSPWSENSEGTITSATVDGVEITGGAGEAVEVSGRTATAPGPGFTVSQLTIKNTTVTGGSSHAFSLHNAACVLLNGNDATGAGGTGYVLANLSLSRFRPAEHPFETVAQWLDRLHNDGSVEALGQIGSC